MSAMLEDTPELLTDLPARAERSAARAASAAETASHAAQRAASAVERLSASLTSGRSELEAKPARAEKKQEKKAAKRLERQIREEARARQPGARMSWFPWAVGLSLGLVIGLVGVAYWQRRRLQTLWGQTSRQVQQRTETLRQRLQASRPQPQPRQSEVPAGTPNFRTLGSTAPGTDQPIGGRREPSLP